MIQYPQSIYLGIFNPMLKEQYNQYLKLQQTHPDIKIVLYTHPDIKYLDNEDKINIMGIWGIKEDNVYTMNDTNKSEYLKIHLQNIEHIFCEKGEQEMFIKNLVNEYKLEGISEKISWIEIPQSVTEFWAEPEKNKSWVHPDIFKLLITNKELIII